MVRAATLFSFNMKWSIHFVTIAGTQVRVHITFFLLLAFIWFSTRSAHGQEAALWTTVFVLALFLCVLLHEFGHVFAARRYGIRTPEITLLPIGGVAHLERMPRRPAHELVVAIAGPLVNVAIAGLLFLFLRTQPPLGIEEALAITSPTSFLMALMVVNLWLVVFNMIPAFPMDGGRVLRALLAIRLDYGRATAIAATIGQALALVGGLIGFMYFHPLLILVAIFIFLGAGQEASAARLQAATNGLPVSSAMMTRFRTLHRGHTLGDAIDFLLQGSQSDFPVVDETGDLRGMLMRADLVRALAEHGRGHPVTDVMVDCPADQVITPELGLTRALEILHASPCNSVPVLTEDDRRLVGLLTRENIGEMIMINSALNRYRRHQAE